LNHVRSQNEASHPAGWYSCHGGRTYFRIADNGCTDMKVNSYTDKFGSSGFEVVLGGNCELETMIRALKFITKVLEDEAKGERD
jgi:hypothetical protein